MQEKFIILGLIWEEAIKENMRYLIRSKLVNFSPLLILLVKVS
jgi:hypothetical protein